MISSRRSTFKKAEIPPKHPLQVYKIREIERAQEKEKEGMHGPCRVLMQGGKKCNRLLKT